MAKRHAAGTTLVSQVRRCQELLLSRAGVDEFHETLRLLLAKVFREREGQGTAPDFGDAQRLLLANAATVARFVDGGAALSAPEDVCEECLRILAPSRISGTAFDVLHAVFEQMTAQLYKADKGQYFTPPQV